MRHEEKLLFISSCLISFSLVLFAGGGKKTMKLNNDVLKSGAVENRCRCKSMLLQIDAVE